MSNALDIRFQNAVVALAEELNYTRAADRLGISQPALTKWIHELEEILGFHLFERDKKKVTLMQSWSRIRGAGSSFIDAR